jgi:hypothetical protein
MRLEGNRLTDTKDWTRILVVGLLIIILSFVLYCTSLLTVDYTSTQKAYFGADHASYIENLERFGVKFERHKRPLLGVIVGSAFVVLVHVIHLPTYIAISIIFALLGSLSVGLMFVILARFFCSTVNAVLVSSCYALAFANVVMFGIPESYSLSVVFILLLFFVIFVANETDTLIPGRVGLLTGIVGWTNPIAMFPVGTYSLFMLGTRPSLRTLRRVITACIVGLLVYSLPSISGYTKGFQGKLDWLHGKGADISNLVDLNGILNTLAAFFSFAVVSPYQFVLHCYMASDLSGYFTNILRFMALSIWVIIGVFTLYSIFRNKYERALLCSSLILSLLSVIIFYIYFGNTLFSVIYSPLFVVGLFLLIGIAAGDSKGAMPLLVLFLVLLALTNVPPLYKTSARLVAAGGHAWTYDSFRSLAQHCAEDPLRSPEGQQ